MIYFYIFKIRYIKGKFLLIVNYLVSFADIPFFIHYLEKKHKNNFAIEGIYDYYSYKNKKILVYKEWYNENICSSR